MGIFSVVVVVLKACLDTWRQCFMKWYAISGMFTLISYSLHLMAWEERYFSYWISLHYGFVSKAALLFACPWDKTTIIGLVAAMNICCWINFPPAKQESHATPGGKDLQDSTGMGERGRCLPSI